MSHVHITIYISIYSSWHLVPSKGHGHGHSRRASTRPYSHIPSMLVPESISNSSIYVLFYLIFPLFNWLSPPRTNFTHIHFLHKLLIFLSLKMTKLPQSIFCSPNALYHTNPMAQLPMLHLSYTLLVLSPFHLVVMVQTWQYSYTLHPSKSLPTFSQIIKKLIERKQSEIRKVHPGLTCFRDGVREIPVESIPGIREAGWKGPPALKPSRSPTQEHQEAEYLTSMLKTLLCNVSPLTTH